jgi:5-methylcytosine-specific restriction endonuclease McrA
VEDVLVLNANFAPINVCTIRRAVGLMLVQKATLVLNGRGEIHTSQDVFPCPSIIRLHHMIHRPRPHITLTRREILRRDNFTCQYCGKHTLDLTVDHIVPRHLGGQHTWENVVAACPSCNHRKGGRPLTGSHMQLHRIPKEPPITAEYIFGRYLSQNHEWADFLHGW